MFRKFAYQFSGPAGEEWGQGWTPPWMQREGWHGPHGPLHAHMHRRGPFGPRGPFGGDERGEGPRGPFGQGGGRFFGRGDVKFALLDLVRERPMYGYEMIKALEEKSGGFYSPSPGSIYPTLQLLEERGLVTAREVEGKKVYSITDAGKALLDEHQQQQTPWEHMRRAREERGHGPRPELHALRHEAGEVARLFAIAGRSAIADPEKVARLRVVIERTRKDLTDLIYGQSGETPTTPPAEPTAE